MQPINLSTARDDRETKALEVEREMSIHFLALALRGRTRARSAEAFYGFTPGMVAELHRYKQGVGPGIWFRLTDGRVFDALGRHSTRAASAYRNRVPGRKRPGNG